MINNKGRPKFYQYNVNENGRRHVPHVQARKEKKNNPFHTPMLGYESNFFVIRKIVARDRTGVLRAHSQNNLG